MLKHLALFRCRFAADAALKGRKNTARGFNLWFYAVLMRAFLTGHNDALWRGEISDYLLERRIDVINPADAVSDSAFVFKQFKLLESCDLLIAYFTGVERRPLAAMLAIGYASKLAKEVMIVDDAPRPNRWRTPYAHSFPNLHDLKNYLDIFLGAPRKQPRLVG